MQSTDSAQGKTYAETEMLEAWREFLDAVCPYIKICAEILVKNIANTVMDKIKEYVNEENTFTVNDEEIFGQYGKLMTDYSEIAGVYNESLASINDFRVSEILNGIMEILSAELKQFEEHMSAYCAARGAVPVNPVKEEKESILKSVYESVLDALNVVWNNILSENGYFDRGELKRFCAESARKTVNESHIDFFTSMYQRVIEKGGLDIYKSYSGAIMECANRINSLELRKEARYFYEALKQEKENLRSIVKIQVQALSIEELSEAERETVEKVTASIAETLKRTEEETEVLDRVFGEGESSVKKPVLMNYDGFLSFVEEKGLCAYTDKLRDEGLETGTLSVAQLWKEKLDRFIQLFTSFVYEGSEPVMDIRPYKRFLYEVRVKITDKLFLTDGIINGFKELAGFYTENAQKFRDTVPADYMRIIDGIHESVVIKIDTLEEGKKSFSEEAEEKVKGFTAPGLSDTDVQMLHDYKLNEWIVEMTVLNTLDDEYETEAQSRFIFFLEKINAANYTEEYGSKMEKKIAKDAGEEAKFEAAYLKDYLLFEIITFEEILTYSVSKLKECEDATEYVRRCEELEEKLIKLCKLHNIAVIKPQPYDLFNSSEHEVLIAEKTEGYKKGQIIKMMNSGFKYNEQVLVRANVIAAK